MVGEDEVEEAEVEEDSGTRTEAIARGVIRQVAALLGDAGARAMIVGARAEALLPGGESAIKVLREVVAVVVDGDAAQATRMLATGATAGTAAVAVVGTVVDVGGSSKQLYCIRDESLKWGAKHFLGRRV